MSISRNWSNVSAPCRLEVGPSRLLAVTLLVLGGLGAASIIASEVARPAAWSIAIAAVAYGVRLARMELRRSVRSLIIPMGEFSAMLDDKPITDFRVQWRGPFAFLQWRAARGLCRMQGWPDTLSARSRRELRLAMIARTTAPPARSMAP